MLSADEYSNDDDQVDSVFSDTEEDSEEDLYDDDDENVDVDQDDIEMQRGEDSEVNESIPHITKYEKVRIIGVRAHQISMGAPTCVDTRNKNCETIAQEEYELGQIPITLLRNRHNHAKEVWSLRQMAPYTRVSDVFCSTGGTRGVFLS